MFTSNWEAGYFSIYDPLRIHLQKISDKVNGIELGFADIESIINRGLPYEEKR